MASPPRKQHRSRRRWWRGRGAGVRLAGRGEQRGFLDLADLPLLVAILDPAGLAGGAGGDRVQTKADGDQGRSAQRAAWHQRTSVRLLGCGGSAQGGQDEKATRMMASVDFMY